MFQPLRRRIQTPIDRDDAQMRLSVVTLSGRWSARTTDMTATAVERPAAGLSWTTLLRGAAIAQCLALAATAAVLGDAEAAAIGVATLVALGLLRFRGGTLGKVLLGLLFADVGFFTGAGAFTNLLARADPVATIGPGAFVAIALPGLAAVVAGFRRAPRASASSRSAVAIVVFMAAAFATLAFTSIFTAGPTTVAAPDVLRLETKSVRFSTGELSATAGTITVRVANRDLFWHTFTIDELGVDLRVPVGGEQQRTFAARPGTYAYYCAIPGHSAAMRGTLTVR